MSGTKGVLAENEFFRNEPGRTKTRQFEIAKGSKIIVESTKKSEFNEIWYKVAILLDGTVKHGYLQASAVELEGVEFKKSKSSLVNVGTDASTHYGKARRSDGVYVVVLDPGHGGPFSGAYHYDTAEKNLNLKVGLECKKYLESHYDNVVVYLTRSGDSILDPDNDTDDLERRVRYAMGKKADILVSMHFDAGSNMHGCEALIPHEKTYTKSKSLGSFILNELSSISVDGSPLKNLGCFTRLSSRSHYSYDKPNTSFMDGYLINRLAAEQGIVNCIIEHLHMDQSDDRKFWNSDQKIKNLAAADARGIAKFLQLPKKGGTTATLTPTEEPTQKVTPKQKPTEEPTPTEEAKPTPTEEAKPTAEPTKIAEPTPSEIPTDNESDGEAAGTP